eukprot:TRINITY_DN522_c0_g1_i1.p1 TRINITY_DN522_c0_g1~~TRINITY_DN522_c0_g1_i1.p1  ORF type:complete len:254 (+),score=32.59 TRINITY_DN522_c0_g1_i1:127-888(+)
MARNRKQLESLLQSANVFSKPKIKLEQYPTNPHLASHIVFMAHQNYDEIEGKVIGELGSGCGNLLLASALMGASYCIGFELDEDAMGIARENFSEYELDTHVEFVRADVTQLVAVGQFSEDDSSSDSKSSENSESQSSAENSESKSSAENFISRWRPLIDTIIMNPPFGTKVQGVDMIFLQVACQMARKSVYSLHKTSTRQYILQKARQWGVEAEILAELKFDIPNMYKFHKKKNVEVEVDLYRFDVSMLHRN